MTDNLQVLISGAGPTGLTLACDLARRGVQFRIVDKAPAYFIGSKGKGLQPRSLEVMDDLRDHRPNPAQRKISPSIPRL